MQHDEELKGVIRIATNDKIKVTVVGEKDYVTYLDLGGYYVVHAKDLKGFINAIKEIEERKSNSIISR